MIIEISIDLHKLQTETTIYSDGYPNEPCMFGYYSSLDRLYEGVPEEVALIMDVEGRSNDDTL